MAELSRRIASGLSSSAACREVGLDPNTFFQWKARGKWKPDSIYGLFLTVMLRAEGERESKLLKQIRDAADPYVSRDGKHDRPGDWRAAAWLLERMHPERYGPQATVRHEGTVQFAHADEMNQALGKLSDDDLTRLRSLVGKMHGARRGSGNGSPALDPVRTVHDADVSGELASCADRELSREGAAGGDQSIVDLRPSEAREVAASE
jgi:hypothetical protein